jgi:putative lipoprotein
MRAAAVLSLSLSILLAACGGSTPAPSASGSATPAQPEGPTVAGTILAEQPAALAPGATLTVRLLDVTRVDGDPMHITTGTFPISALPAEFNLSYNPADVNPIRTYAIDATVMDQGQVRFVSNGRIGVLTQGKPKRVTVMMAQAMAAAAPKDPVAELNKAFAEFEQQLGGLKRVTGERINEEKEIAIGWDAFFDDSGVRLVREMISYPDGSRVNARFAFLDGKPWVVVHESGGTTSRLGWDAEGNLVVQEKNGQPAEFSEEQAAGFRRQAREARSLVQAQAGGGK